MALPCPLHWVHCLAPVLRGSPDILPNIMGRGLTIPWYIGSQESESFSRGTTSDRYLSRSHRSQLPYALAQSQAHLQQQSAYGRHPLMAWHPLPQVPPLVLSLGTAWGLSPATDHIAPHLQCWACTWGTSHWAQLLRTLSLHCCPKSPCCGEAAQCLEGPSTSLAQRQTQRPVTFWAPSSSYLHIRYNRVQP